MQLIAAGLVIIKKGVRVICTVIRLTFIRFVWYSDGIR